MGSAPPPDAEGNAEPRHLGRVLASSLWFPALFFVGFLVCYLIPFHAPTPLDVPVAVAGPQVAAAVEEGFAQQAPGAYDVLPVADDAAARAAIDAREAVAAYVVGGGGATLYTAGADGKLLGQVVTSTFTEVAASGGADLEVVDLVPTEAGDLTGTGLFYLALVWNLVPYVTVMMLARATELSRRAQLGVLAAVGAFISVVGYLVGLSIDVMPNHPLAIVYAFALTQAVAWTTYGLAPLVKQFLPGVAIALFVLLSIPSSGGAIPHQLVPGFFAALHPVMPLGNVVDALRGIFYFDDVGLLRPTLVLGAWLAGSAALVAAVAVRSRRLERSAGQPQGGVREGAGRGPHPDGLGAPGHRPAPPRPLPGGERAARRCGPQGGRRPHVPRLHHRARRRWAAAVHHPHRRAGALRRRGPARGVRDGRHPGAGVRPRRCPPPAAAGTPAAPGLRPRRGVVGHLPARPDGGDADLGPAAAEPVSGRPTAVGAASAEPRVMLAR